MYSNIKVYQNYLVTSIKICCATRSLYASSGPKPEGVPTNNQRGRGSGQCRLWRGLDKVHHIVPTALLVSLQRFRNDPYKAVKGPSTRPIVSKFRVINGEYIVKISRGIIELVYEVKPLGFPEVWHKIPLVTI